MNRERLVELGKESERNSVKRIATHNGIFHADEITAIALLKVFKPEYKYIVDRLPHNDPIENPQDYDYIIDIGRQYDNKRYFDHHQMSIKEDNRASAGLIFDHLLSGLESEYEEIFSFICQVDNNDLGIKEPEQHSIISLIKCLNTNDIYEETQNEAFNRAVEIITDYIRSLKNQVDKRADAYHMLMSAKQQDNIMISDEFINDWQYHLAGSEEIDFFMWFDKNQNIWKIQTVPVIYGSFEFKKPLEPSKKNDEVTFIHNGKFFAIGSREGLLKLVKDSYKGE